MKKLIGTIALITVAAAPAMASKARVAALQSPFHIVDTQTVFARPVDMLALPEFVTVEFGSSDLASTNPKAEGGFTRSLGNGKTGFFLGHGASQREAGTFLSYENPFNIVYATKVGDLSWGVDFGYSSSDKKSTPQKQSAMGLTGSVGMGAWIVDLTVSLGDTAKNDASTTPVQAEGEYKATGMTLDGTYGFNANLTGLVSYDMATKKITNATATTTDLELTDITVGVIDARKKDGTEFFYGVNLKLQTIKDKATPEVKNENTLLPVIVGLESEANSWLTLRGSVTEEVLLSSRKTTTTPAATTDGTNTETPHSTTVAAGIGLKFNKAILDMTLNSSTTGNVTGSTLGANASLTYNF